jgi:hypothetical protein
MASGGGGGGGANEPRFHVLAQLEHLQSKYTGTGHADMQRY